MRIAIAGSNGNLGGAVEKMAGDKIVARGDLPFFDMGDRSCVEEWISSANADVVVNCAAFTNVDGCVSDYPSAYRANAIGPQNLAHSCREAGIPLVHISTNEVFDGSNETGYEEWMPVNPINHYGKSKAAGEFNIRSVLQEHYIVRTAWLMAPKGRNFVHAILGRASQGQDLRVVTDEIGNPTYVDDLAEAILKLIETGQYGTYHFVNEGACSRWEFANEILKQAGIEGIENEPILSSEFDRASTPPPFGQLHNLNGAASWYRTSTMARGFSRFSIKPER